MCLLPREKENFNALRFSVTLPAYSCSAPIQKPKKSHVILPLLTINTLVAMPSIHQNSVRDELDRLKNEIDRLSSNGDMSSETKILMRSMLTLLELIFSISLEKSAIKISKNSSKPSSQTDKDESALGAVRERAKRAETICQQYTYRGNGHHRSRFKLRYMRGRFNGYRMP